MSVYYSDRKLAPLMILALVGTRCVFCGAGSSKTLFHGAMMEIDQWLQTNTHDDTQISGVFSTLTNALTKMDGSDITKLRQSLSTRWRINSHVPILPLFLQLSKTLTQSYRQSCALRNTLALDPCPIRINNEAMGPDKLKKCLQKTFADFSVPEAGISRTNTRMSKRLFLKLSRIDL